MSQSALIRGPQGDRPPPGAVVSAQDLEQLLFQIRWRNRTGEVTDTGRSGLESRKALWITVVGAAITDAMGEPPGLWCRGRALLSFQAEALVFFLSTCAAPDRQMVCENADIHEDALTIRVRHALQAAQILDPLTDRIIREIEAESVGEEPAEICSRLVSSLSADLCARRRAGLLPAAANRMAVAEAAAMKDPVWASNVSAAAARRTREDGHERLSAD